MQALEAEIAGALLERTTGGVRPTDAGHALASTMWLSLKRRSLQNGSADLNQTS
jgi:hypothetical protein